MQLKLLVSECTIVCPYFCCSELILHRFCVQEKERLELSILSMQKRLVKLEEKKAVDEVGSWHGRVTLCHEHTPSHISIYLHVGCDTAADSTSGGVEGREDPRVRAVSARDEDRVSCWVGSSSVLRHHPLCSSPPQEGQVDEAVPDPETTV